MGFNRKYKPKKRCKLKSSGCIELCSVPDSPVDSVRSFYCSGEVLPKNAVGSVAVCLDNLNDDLLVGGDAVPMTTNGFVILDRTTMKMKFVPGKAPAIDAVVIPESIQETFCAGEYLPETMIGKVDFCLLDKTEDCAGSLDLIPSDIDGWISYDEVTHKAKWIQGKVTDTVRSDEDIASIVLSYIEALPSDTTRSDAEIKQVVDTCIALLPEDQVRTDAEIIALVYSVVNEIPADTTRSDAEIKSIAQACIDALPDDQVRTDAEISAIAKAVTQACIDGLDADQVRSDAEIKTIAENCYTTLSADFLTSSQIYAYIDSRPDLDTDTVRSDLEIQALAKVVAQACVDNLTLPVDTVRSDLEIQQLAEAVAHTIVDNETDDVRSDLEISGIANQVFKSCLALLPEDETRSDLEIMALAKNVFSECISNLDLEHISDEEIQSQSKIVFLQCINDYIRSDAEIISLVQNYINDLPEVDSPRTDAEIKNIAQDCIDLLPADQVRTDAEIKGIVETCLTLLPEDQVRTDAEINALAKDVAQACVDALPEDQVRSDAEIKSISLECIENHPSIRTDSELEIFITEFVGEGVTPRTDSEIKAIAQACIDLLPADQVRSNAEIKAIVEDCLALLPADVDTVRSDAEIKAIAQSCINANPDIDTFGIPQEATQAGNDFFGKAYTIGSNIIVYPGNVIVCIDGKQQPVSVRVSGEPASILSCLAECQYVYNCEANTWFQMIDSTLVSVPTAGIPPVSYFFGDIEGRSFACKYEDFGNVYCHNYVQSYLHGEQCTSACIGSVSTITLPAVDTGNSTTVTFNWGDGFSDTYSDGDIPTHDYAELYSGKIEACFDKCADPTFAWASATGTFQYIDSKCGC